MDDICHLNTLKCLNNGKCAVNISSNTTYCQCGSCYDGALCEAPVWLELDAGYALLVMYIVQLCFSILNNGLVLELFICSRRLRSTNSGVYLMAYSIPSFLSSILLSVHEFVTNYRNQLSISYDQYVVFRCYVNKVGYPLFVNLCILFSSCIAIERGLIICFGSKMKASRWRLGTTTIFILGVGVGTTTPSLVYKCNWQSTPNLQTLRSFSSWFYMVTGIAIYLLATLLVLISFARRIRRYGMEDGSYIKTFLKLLYTHLFILVPPIAYVICHLPYTISYAAKNANHSYYRCGIPTIEYLVKVLAEALKGAPIVVPWLLFIYPSRVYMTEFYLNTWSGQYLAKLLLLFKLYNNRAESSHSSAAILINDEHYRRVATV